PPAPPSHGDQLCPATPAVAATDASTGRSRPASRGPTTPLATSPAAPPAPRGPAPPLGPVPGARHGQRPEPGHLVEGGARDGAPAHVPQVHPGPGPGGDVAARHRGGEQR